MDKPPESEKGRDGKPKRYFTMSKVCIVGNRLGTETLFSNLETYKQVMFCNLQLYLLF